MTEKKKMRKYWLTNYLTNLKNHSIIQYVLLLKPTTRLNPDCVCFGKSTLTNTIKIVNMEKVLSNATDAVLVAGPGLIIQSRKSVVGSNPTRRTI